MNGAENNEMNSEEGRNIKIDNVLSPNDDENRTEVTPSANFSSAVPVPSVDLKEYGFAGEMQFDDISILPSKNLEIATIASQLEKSNAKKDTMSQDNLVEDKPLPDSIYGDDNATVGKHVQMKSISHSSIAHPSNPDEGKKEARRKRILRKAPDAPKRFKSAYICYVVEKMDEVKKTLAEDVKATEAMKTLALMWKELPPETKSEYEKIAEGDKTRYYAEMRDYTGPMHVPNKRQKKPAGAPKRAMSAFLSFSQQMRPQVRAKNPNMKNTDISGVLAQMWREGTEEEKAPHINRELRDREKYHEDMSKWKEEVSQQAELDAINAAAGNEAHVKETERERMGFGASSISSGSSDANFVPSMGNGISSSASNVPCDEYDFFHNVWMDSGWSAVDKLIQDAERDEPGGAMSGNVRQDFFGGQSGGRYNSRDQFLNFSMDPPSFNMRQPSYLHSQQQQHPRTLPPMMPPLQAQGVDVNSFQNASSLLNHTATAYNTMSNNGSSPNLSNVNASCFDWRTTPQGQYVPVNPFNEHHQQPQFYSPQDGSIDNRNIYNNSHNFDNFQHQLMLQHQRQMQQRQEYQRRYQQYHQQQHR